MGEKTPNLANTPIWQSGTKANLANLANTPIWQSGTKANLANLVKRPVWQSGATCSLAALRTQSGGQLNLARNLMFNLVDAAIWRKLPWRTRCATEMCGSCVWELRPHSQTPN